MIHPKGYGVIKIVIWRQKLYSDILSDIISTLPKTPKSPNHPKEYLADDHCQRIIHLMPILAVSDELHDTAKSRTAVEADLHYLLRLSRIGPRFRDTLWLTIGLLPCCSLWL